MPKNEGTGNIQCVTGASKPFIVTVVHRIHMKAAPILQRCPISQPALNQKKDPAFVKPLQTTLRSVGIGLHTMCSIRLHQTTSHFLSPRGWHGAVDNSDTKNKTGCSGGPTPCGPPHQAPWMSSSSAVTGLGAKDCAVVEPNRSKKLNGSAKNWVGVCTVSTQGMGRGGGKGASAAHG